MTPVSQRDRRVHRRIAVGLPMLVRGIDALGTRFEDAVQSYDVSRTGASFLTARDLAVGMDVEIVIPHVSNGRSSDADFSTLGRIVRVTAGKSEGEHNVGVEFLGARFRRVFSSESGF